MCIRDRLKPCGVDAARLVDAEVVARKPEAGPQAESPQIQPAGFVRRALFATVYRGQKCVGELANSRQWPGVLPQSEYLLEFGR